MPMIIKNNNNNVEKVPSGFKLCVDICLTFPNKGSLCAFSLALNEGCSLALICPPPHFSVFHLIGGKHSVA